MTTSADRAWVKRVERGVFNKAQCNQWAKAVFSQSRYEPPQGARTNLTMDEAIDLMEILDSKPGVRLTPEHEKQGIEWLRSYGVKRLGLPQEVIDKFDHFSFHGQGRDVSGGGSYRANWMPVWRIHTTDGGEYDYFSSAWQSAAYPIGGSPDRQWWLVCEPVS
jgi:hypothetical protein